MKKSFKEKVELSLRKKWLASGTRTILVVIILITAFLFLNYWIQTVDLPKIDVTENKVYTLSDSSKNEIKKIEQEVKVYIYGYKEEDTIVDLLKQYSKCNSNIKYEFLKDEQNKDKITQFGLETGNMALILEVGETNKILFSNDFYSYDYSTYQQIDLTENAITNAILNLTIAKKPKVYVLTGHAEFSVEQYLTYILSYLKNEVFDYSTLNLITVDTIPADCNLIAVFSPQKDLLDDEFTKLENYINNGGNIIFTKDFVNKEGLNLPNFQKILDMYGVSVENGAVYETDPNSYVANSPFIFLPKIECTDITSDICTDGAVLMEFAQRINTVDEATQGNLKVKYETLLTSSEKSFYLTEFSDNAIQSLANQTPSKSTIALKATKTISEPNADTGIEGKESEMIIIGNGLFVTNIESMVSAQTAQVNIYNNADFFVKSVANLTDRNDTISVRKEMSSSTYAPTEQQNVIVLIIIFTVPVVIIIAGCIVWSVRKRKR